MTIQQFIKRCVYGQTKYRFLIYDNIALENIIYNFDIDYHSNDPDISFKVNKVLDIEGKATLDHIGAEEDGFLKIVGYFEG